MNAPFSRTRPVGDGFALLMTITHGDTCRAFVFDPSATRRRITGTVADCDTGSAFGAFVARRMR